MSENKQKINKKSGISLVTILIILIVVLIVLSVIAYMVVTSDLFKSDKQLFYDNISKIMGNEESFIGEDLEKYLESKNISIYKNSTELDFDIRSSEIVNVNNFRIISNGNVNVFEDEIIQNMIIQYSEDVTFPLIYKEKADLIGIQTNNIGSKFVALKSGDLSEYKDILGIMSTLQSFQMLQELNSINLLNKDVLNKIQDSFTNENFSKTQNGDISEYKLSTSIEAIEGLLLEIYNTIEKELQNEDLKTKLKDLIGNVGDENTDSKVDIILYNRKSNLIKIGIHTENINFEIDKMELGNEISYIINYERNEIGTNKELNSLELEISFENILEGQIAKETYNLEIQDKIQNNTYIYEMVNEVEFINDFEVQDFTQDDTMFLYERTNEQISEFINAVEERLKDVNKTQMKEIGLQENQNPLNYIVPELSEENINLNSSEGNQVEIKTTEATVVEYNKKFENYQGTKHAGTTVKGLFTTISVNNEDNTSINKILEINFNSQEYQVTQDILGTLKNELKADRTYTVEVIKNEDGIIYRIVITEEQIIE